MYIHPNVKYAVFIGLVIVTITYAFQTPKSNPKKYNVKATTNSSSSENRPKKWQLGRFLRTLSYYDVLTPKFLKRSTTSSSAIINKGTLLWSPTYTSELKWGPLDDVVMGGISKSDLDPGSAFDGKWTGYVTTEGGGGFAGIRTKLFQPPYDVSSCQGIELKVIGDGQRYKFIARDDDNWNGIAWSYSFDTIKNKSMIIKIPFSKLKPTRFAKTLTDKQIFDVTKLTGIQLSLSKFEYDGGYNPTFRDGIFEFNLLEIKTY